MTGRLSGASDTHRGVMGPHGRAAKRERLVLAATPGLYPPPGDEAETGTFTAALDTRDALTDPLPAATVPPDGCRALVNGHRCGHLRAAHLPSGYNGRRRCGCGCPEYRMPWDELAKTVGYALLWAVPIAVLIVGSIPIVVQLLVTGWTP